MDNEQGQLPAQELCTIRIAFPIESDQQAIDYKKKVSDVLSSISAVQIQFSIMSIPARTPNVPSIR